MAELPRGIYWQSGATPPRHFAVAFLRARPGRSAAAVGATLAKLVDAWRGLAEGRVADLPGTTVPPSGFEWLIAYGRNVFDLAGLTRRLPRNLDREPPINPPLPQGGGSVIGSSHLHYASGVMKNPATEDIAVLMFGDTPLATSRGIVETWKHLQGDESLLLATAYTGFNREDHRSWIDFHDGISNLRSGAERQSAIAVKPTGLPARDRWTVGGTYLAFLRVAVDLALWRKVSPAEQAIIVGRAKISGCPLQSVAAGQGVPVAGCPAAPDIIDPANSAFFEPPAAPDDTIKLSHVQRANHHLNHQISNPRSRRIFRQGYEFLDPPALDAPMRAGLNFVSFQDDPERLLFILNQNGWLGEVNFGGAAPDRPLLAVLAAGLFYCPPVVPDERFPGASLFPAEDFAPIVVASMSMKGARSKPASRRTGGAKKGNA